MNENRGLWRGKDVESCEWVTGYYSVSFDDKPYIEQRISRWTYEVDPSTLGECTGLCDKNGTLIFEGDIVEYKNVNYEIKYIEGFAAFSLRSVDNMNYAPCITTNTVPHMSVIGNVHDNPKLLKGAEDETMDKTRN